MCKCNILLPPKKGTLKIVAFQQKETVMKRKKNSRDGKPRRLKRREKEIEKHENLNFMMSYIMTLEF